MCEFIGWDVANSDCKDWGNFRNVESSVYSGYCSGRSGMDRWTQKKDIVKSASDDWIKDLAIVFPCGMFKTKDGRDTAQKNIFDIAGNVWDLTTEYMLTEK